MLEEGALLGLITATDALEPVMGEIEDPLDEAQTGDDCSSVPDGHRYGSSAPLVGLECARQFLLPPAERTPVFDQILFPTDGGEGADVVLDHVLDVAAAYGSTVHLLYVADTARDSVVQVRGDVVDVLEREGEQVVERAADRASERGVTTLTEVLQGDPYQTIVDYAGTRAIDLIAMPTHGRRGLERFLLGSITERVVRQSDVPVLTIRPADDRRIRFPYRDVLVPTDGSAGAMEALSIGIDVSRSEGATLHLLSVISATTLGVDVRTDVHRAELEASANRILDESAGIADESGVESITATVERATAIHEGILTYIDDNDVGLVVVGTHGRTGFDRYLLGSVTEYLVRTAPIPVLTVRPPEGES